MPRLKVCGITDAAFAVEAAKRGVDYLGLIFAARSPRHVTTEQAHEIAAAVSAWRASSPDTHHPRLVGVFVEQDATEIMRIAKAVPLDVVQLHRTCGAELVATPKAEGYEVWRLYGADFAGEDATLLDGSDGKRQGGTGRRADWSQIAALKRAGRRVILAGGLSAANIAAAAATGADVLDVNSSLETAPGVKSVRLLDEFLASMSKGNMVK